LEVEAYNRQRLDEFKGQPKEYLTEYRAKKPEYLAAIKKNAPIPETIYLKKGALVMLRQNDPDRRWVNGSLGTIRKMESERLSVSLLSGPDVDVEPVSFSHLDGDGKEQATARNFPVTVAYATTIHKAQGMTIDQLRVDLRGAWEHGQAYVALSRAKSAAGLNLDGWSPQSVVIDRSVIDFFRREEIPF
jgi:ATP-dependent exoDNAse (exonuclease V) alpha subunit